MAKLRLYEFDLTVYQLEDKIDKTGNRYLEAKGYHRYDGITVKGVHYDAYDAFSKIILYGTNDILDETIRRLNKSSNKKLLITVIDSDIMNKLSKSTLLSYLVVYYFDFKTNRVGTRKLIKRLQEKETENYE